MPERRDAKLLQVLVRQAREDRLVYVILAECCLILPEAQAPQPDHDVHDGAPNSGCGPFSCGPWSVSRRLRKRPRKEVSVSVVPPSKTVPPFPVPISARGQSKTLP